MLYLSRCDSAGWHFVSGIGKNRDDYGGTVGKLERRDYVVSGLLVGTLSGNFPDFAKVILGSAKNKGKWVDKFLTFFLDFT